MLKSEKYSEENRRQYEIQKIGSKIFCTVCDFSICHTALKQKLEDSRKKK